MRFPSLAVFTLAALCGASVVSLAGPRRSPPQMVPAGTPIQRIQVGPELGGAAATCFLGFTGTPFSVEDVIYFDGDDAYYSYLNIDSMQCVGCGENATAIVRKAHMTLYFPATNTLPCSLEVRTRVVGVVQATCRFQDSLSVLCPGFFTKLVHPTPGTFGEFEINFPDTCKLFTTPPMGIGQAFLEIKFNTVNPSCSDSLNKPQIVTRQAGTLCTSYNPVGSTNLDFVLEYNTGNPLMSLEVETCQQTVPVKRRSWGRLKSIYR